MLEQVNTLSPQMLEQVNTLTAQMPDSYIVHIHVGLHSDF